MLPGRERSGNGSQPNASKNHNRTTDLGLRGESRWTNEAVPQHGPYGRIAARALLSRNYRMANATDHDRLSVESAEARSSRKCPIRVGCAGWGIPREAAGCFSSEGLHLERYARVLNCCEINSTFYRSHKEATWVRWRQLVPPEFRFSVKMPRAITHEGALNCDSDAVSSFFRQIGALSEKAGRCPDLITTRSRVRTSARQSVSGDASRELLRGHRLGTPPQHLV